MSNEFKRHDATACGYCGCDLPPRVRPGGSPRRWCSARCANAAHYAAHTGVAVARAAAWRQANPDRHRALAREWNRRKRVPVEPRMGQCAVCSASFRMHTPRQLVCSTTTCRRTHASARAAARRPARIAVAVGCAFCAATFEPPRRNQRFCSALCQNRDKNRRAYRASSARRFPHFRPKERAAIYARDGGRCGICHAPFDPALAWPHPGSYTIDHIDPDGPHDPANWQAAHNVCNREKGRSVA